MTLLVGSLFPEHRSGCCLARMLFGCQVINGSLYRSIPLINLLPFPDAVTVGNVARLLGGSGKVSVGFAAPKLRKVAKTGTKAKGFILAREDRSPSSMPRQVLKLWETKVPNY